MTANHMTSAPRVGGTTEMAPPLGEDTRQDRTRWGPIWAGFLVVLSTYLVLQLFFFAIGILDLGFDGANSTTAASIVSGVLALVAFFLGGLAAGASAFWRSASDGLVHGVLVWALSVVGILALALLGGGALLGTVASIATEVTNIAQQAQEVNVNPAQVLQAGRETAGWAALSLGLSVTAAALGGLLGAKLWPSRRGHSHAVR